jgi:ketosteroid isomerase-like protein
MADDGAWTVAGRPETFHHAGALTKAERKAACLAFMAVVADMRMEVLSTTAEGDRVAIEAEGNGVTHEGTPYRNQYCFVVTVRDGKIVQANEYFCTKLADQVLWPLAEKMHALGETQG